VTWVESQLPPSGSTTMDQVIHLTLTDAALQTTSDFKLDVFREYPYLLELVRGEVTRPQVVVDGEALMVGYLRPEDFIAFVRVSEQGAKLCGPTPLKGIRGWGAAHSMAVTPFGVLFAATYKDGSTDLYRVSQPPGAPGQACVVEHLGWLSARDAMIASNARLDVSLGDAAIALGAGGRLGVTWVERAATAAESDPSHLMFRVLGPKLCD
jgi:hypothetical protein